MANIKSINNPAKSKNLSRLKGSSTKQFSLFKDKKPAGSPTIIQNFRQINELEKYQHLFEYAMDALILVDIDGKIVDLNYQAELLFKKSKDEVIGSDHGRLYVSHHPHFREEISPRNIHGKKEFHDLKINLANGSQVFVSVLARRMKVSGEEMVYYRLADLSQHILKEKKLHENSKMTAIHRFLAGTSQEIQYPLQAVLNKSQNIIDKYAQMNFEYIGYKEFVSIMNSISDINNQIQSCCSIANRLSSINRKKAGFKESFSDVNKVIHDVLLGMHDQIKVSYVKVVRKFYERLPKIPIDPLELQQVVINIVMNALQAMPAGGRLEIKTYYVKESNLVRIEFKDEGEGIDKENLSRVFEPFFTTKQQNQQKCPGLGLSIVYFIVKSYQGDIAVESSLRHGTLVKVSLPIHSEIRIKKPVKRK